MFQNSVCSVESKFKMLRQFILLLVVLLCTSTASIFAKPSISSNQDYRCASLTKCDCFGSKDYEISCPNRTRTDIVIRVERQRLTNGVEIECSTSNTKVYDQLPEWNIGDSYIVKLKSCPIASNHPIQQIFHQLGIRNVHSLVVQMESKSIEEQQIIPTQFFENLPNIKSLHLRTNAWNISLNNFSNLHNLEILQLSLSNINNLNKSAFYNQNNLKRLNLWANKLQKFTKETLIGAASITHLDLIANEIDSIHSNVFEYLVNVSEMIINGNQLIEIPQNMFKMNKALRVLHLESNRLKNEKIPNGLLSRLLELQEVTISGHNIQHLPENLFKDSLAIQNISLIHNALVDIPVAIFKTQINLIVLDLSYNNLSTLDDFLFNATIRLKVLRLSHNRLNKISR